MSHAGQPCGSMWARPALEAPSGAATDLRVFPAKAAAIYLSQGDQGRGGGGVWAGVEDCAETARGAYRRGCADSRGPQNFPWALEMRVEDPDTNVIRFGSEPE